MTTNQKIARKLRETAAKLIKRAEELEAGKHPTSHIPRPTCIHGEYTDEPFNGCKTCGNPKVVICSCPDVVGKRRNGNGCNAANCRYFVPVADNPQT
ncbi:MAG: hypothetical protein WCS27_15350 [Victivallaceae bacterium]